MTSRQRPDRPVAGAVIVAAGASRRMGGADKVFARLGGKPLLVHVVEAFVACRALGQIVVVMSRENIARGRRLLARGGWEKPVEFCLGGERRQDSVAAGLQHLDRDWTWVVVHDAARPLVTPGLVERGLKAAAEVGAAVAAVPVADTIKLAGADGTVKQTLERGSLYAVQTPQVFRRDIIDTAYHRVTGDATDDASLVERAGYRVRLFPGDHDNIKVTTPEDLVVAAALWKERQRKGER